MGLPTWLVNPEDLVEGLEEVANGGHKGDSILGDGDKLDKLMFDNKIVRLLGVLKESTPIGDKVIANLLFMFYYFFLPRVQ